MKYHEYLALHFINITHFDYLPYELKRSIESLNKKLTQKYDGLGNKKSPQNPILRGLGNSNK